MSQKSYIVGLMLILVGATTYAQQGEVQLAYISHYKQIAIREMERTGIPASIKLAQAILESNAGRSDLARRANNHFGIKCGSNWPGNTLYKKDDDVDKNGKLIKSCFRSYKSGKASFTAHSEFLRDPKKAFRYGFLFRLNPKSYHDWAHGLRRSGYATSPTYPEDLIRVIEAYELYTYDNQTTSPSPANDLIPNGILSSNDVRYTLTQDGETLNEVSNRVQINIARLINYNENIKDENATINTGNRVYLQPKRNGYRGKIKHHKVQLGETMFIISQEYGVKEHRLYHRNRMESGQQPAVDEQVKLSGRRVKHRPKLRSEVTSTDSAVPLNENGDIEFDDSDVITPEPPRTHTPPKPEITPPPSTNVQPENNSANGGGAIIIQPSSKPVDTNTSTIPARPTTEVNTTAASLHTVISGETLYSISKKYNTTVEKLKALNNLQDNNIQIGMQLRIK